MAQPTDNRGSDLARLISDEDLECIFRATRVPENYRVAATRGIQFAILRTQNRARRMQVSRYSRSTKGCLRRIENLSNELHEAISRLRKLDQRLYSSISFSDWVIADDEDEDDVLSLFELEECLEELAESCRRLKCRTKKAPNRPRGSVKNPTLQWLIFELYDAIVRIGRGKLSLSRDPDDRPKGAIIDVLKILQRSLPGIIRTRLPPYPTLRRIIWRAANRDGLSRLSAGTV